MLYNMASSMSRQYQSNCVVWLTIWAAQWGYLSHLRLPNGWLTRIIYIDLNCKIKEINFFKTFFVILLHRSHISKAIYLNLFEFKVDFFTDRHKPIAVLPISTLTASCLSILKLSGSENSCTGCYRLLIIIESEEHQRHNHWTLRTPNSREYYCISTMQIRKITTSHLISILMRPLPEIYG